MTLTTMELPQFVQPMTAEASSPEEWKVKLESGELDNKLKLWIAPSKNIVVALLTLRSTVLTLRLSLAHTMDHASFGI